MDVRLSQLNKYYLLIYCVNAFILLKPVEGGGLFHSSKHFYYSACKELTAGGASTAGFVGL